MVDAKAFAAEAAALLPTLHKISMSILRSEADAQDAVQQAFLKAWAARETAWPERLRAWLTRICINECRNIQRQRKRVTPVSQVMAPVPFHPPDLDVTLAIEGLSEKLRLPFVMKYAGRYTEREIALALGVPVTTVKGRLHSARQTLRKSLADREVVFE